MNFSDFGVSPRGLLLLLDSLRRTGLRLTGLLALALLLSACSTVKIAYNQAPELLYWYFDAYADFSDAQSPQVKGDLNRLHDWHRHTQLPDYVVLLQGAQRQVRADISPPQACEVYADVRRKLLAVYQHAEPSVAVLAASLDAAQLQHMERRFAKGNAEFRADFVDGTPDAMRKRRLKKAVSRAEMLYGRLDDRQMAMLSRVIGQSGFDAARSYAERLRRQRDALDTFRALAATPAADRAGKAAQAVKGLMERSAASPDPAYRDYAEALTTEGCKSYSELHNATSAAQRAKAVKVLEGYEKDLTELAGQNPG